MSGVTINGVPYDEFVAGTSLDRLRAIPVLDGQTVQATPPSTRRRNGRVRVRYDLARVLERAAERNVQCTDD